MNIKKHSRIYSLVAAICLALRTVYRICAILPLIDLGADLRFLAPLIFYVFTLGMFSVTLFLQNTKLFFVASILCVLSDIYYLVVDFNFKNILVIAALLVLVAMTFSAIHSRSDLKTIWFLPAVIYLLASIISEVNLHKSYTYPTPLVNILVNYVAMILAYFFAGLWLKSIVPPKAHSPSNRTSAQANATADQFKQYKDLLDSGAITEEEFQAKKKEKLGL